MDPFGKKVLSGSVWVWDPVGIFLYVPRSLLDQVLVCLLAPGFIAIALYNQQGPYFRQIKLDFTLCGIPAARRSHPCLINAHLLGQKKKRIENSRPTWENAYALEIRLARSFSPQMSTVNKNFVLHFAAKKSLRMDIFVRQGPIS